MSANLQGFGAVPAAIRPLDEEQARLVEILRAAGGTPVSFERLRALGIENPATLAYELEIAGHSIEYVKHAEAAGGSARAGIRLEAAREERSAPPGRATASRPPATAAGRGRAAQAPAAAAFAGSRAVPLLAALAGVLVLAALTAALAGSLDGSRTPGAARTGAARSRSARLGAAVHSAQRQPAPAVHPAAHSPAARSPAGNAAGSGGSSDAAELQATGHRLLEAGDYGAAVSELRAAVGASGESSKGCAEATSSACLTYAYALYDLGRALQLDHHPAAAVTVLRERLLIDNQRPTVQRELTSARRGLRRRAASPPRPSGSRPGRSGADGPGPAGPPAQQTAPAAGGAGSTPSGQVSTTGGLQAPGG